MNWMASTYHLSDDNPLTYVKVRVGLVVLGVIVPMVTQVLLVASPGPLAKAVVVLGNVVLDTPVTAVCTTMLPDSWNWVAPIKPQLTATW